MSNVVMRKDRDSEGKEKLEMVPDDQSRTSQITFSEEKHPRWLLPVVIIVCLLFLGGLVCLLVAVFKKPGSCPATEAVSSKKEACLYSAEAKRVDLEGFLKEVQKKYYEMNPDNVAWQPDIEDQGQHVREL